MSYESNVPDDAEDLIDWLVGVQTLANEVSDPEQKILRVRYTLHAASIALYKDQQYYIDCALLFAQRSNSQPNARTIFDRGMAFTGTFVGLNYLQDYDVPIDSLTVNFGEPSVVYPDIEHCREFETQTFQVPVMAIDSHVSLGLAA